MCCTYIKKIIVFFSILLITSSLQLFATYNFNGTNSAIKVGPGATFNVDSDLNVINGSLIKDATANITGNPIYMTHSILESHLFEGLITGTYDPTGEDIIKLHGNPNSLDRLRCQPGNLIHQLQIYGTNNRLDGQPIFKNPIWFDNYATLTIGIVSNLNQNLQLNDGTLILDNELNLADNIQIMGTGTVECNNQRFAFGGKDLHGTHTVNMVHASDIHFNNYFLLSGMWVMDQDAEINGHANTFDLCPIGTMVIKPNTTVNITDLTMRIGWLIFEDESSTLKMTRSHLELCHSVTFTTGGFYVDDESSFILKGNDITIDMNASITVDHTILWLDNINAPRPADLYWNNNQADAETLIDTGTILRRITITDLNYLHQLITENTYNINNNWELTISNSTVIIDLVACCSEVKANCCGESGVDDPCTTTEDLLPLGQVCCSRFVHPGQYAHITTDTFIDGCGAIWIFADPDHAQFIIDANTTVTLLNIDFTRINRNTFDLGKNSKIYIGENVNFEIAENITFTSGLIQVLEGTNKFVMRSIDGQHKVSFAPDCPNEYLSRQNVCRHRNLCPDPMLDITDGYLELQNIEVSGIQYIQHSTTGTHYILLNGETAINVEQDTLLNFKAQGEENELRFLKNNINLKGTITFGDCPENLLHIRSPIPEKLTELPTILLGDNCNGYRCIYLTSDLGRASLIFNDDAIIVKNLGENSFVTADHAYLGGNIVDIRTNPIKQTTTDLELASNLTLLSDQPQAIIFDSDDPFKSLMFDDLDKFDELELESTRYPNITSDDTLYYDMTTALGNASGLITLQNTTATNFYPHVSDALSLTMKNGSTLNVKDTAVTIKSSDTVAVSGTNNTIKVSNQLTINGALTCAANAHLVFEFDEQATNPTVIFPASSTLTLASNVRIEFKGNGTVQFGDGSQIIFMGGSPKSSLIIHDGATMQLASNATATMRGQGIFMVTDGGTVSIEGNQNLVIGSSTSDAIHISLARGGTIKLDSSNTTNARLSLNLGTHSLSVAQSGMLFVGTNGIAEFNVLNGAISAGTISNVTFESNGILYVDSTGKLSLAHNLGSAAFTWDSISAIIKGTGFIEFVSSVGTSFTGTIQSAQSHASYRSTSATFETLAEQLVQTISTLTVTTVFVNESSSTIIRTSTGALITLNSGEEVISDDASGNVTIFSATLGEYVTYDTNGNII